MTLPDALATIRADGTFAVLTGPAAQALAYVDTLDLEAAVAAQDPLLFGALLALWRHLCDDPTAHVAPRAYRGGWRVWLSAGREYLEPVAETDLDTLVAAFVGEAQERIRESRP